MLVIRYMVVYVWWVLYCWCFLMDRVLSVVWKCFMVIFGFLIYSLFLLGGNMNGLIVNFEMDVMCFRCVICLVFVRVFKVWLLSSMLCLCLVFICFLILWFMMIWYIWMCLVFLFILFYWRVNVFLGWRLVKNRNLYSVVYIFEYFLRVVYRCWMMCFVLFLVNGFISFLDIWGFLRGVIGFFLIRLFFIVEFRIVDSLNIVFCFMFGDVYLMLLMIWCKRVGVIWLSWVIVRCGI